MQRGQALGPILTNVVLFFEKFKVFSKRAQKGGLNHPSILCGGVGYNGAEDWKPTGD
jgi:hypothetical protein